MSDIPEFRMLSSNRCPNREVVVVGLEAADLHNGPTMFGYCGYCWTSIDTTLIPLAWITRVGDRLEGFTL
jgi:hypothetical protein